MGAHFEIRSIVYPDSNAANLTRAYVTVIFCNFPILRFPSTRQNKTLQIHQNAPLTFINPTIHNSTRFFSMPPSATAKSSSSPTKTKLSPVKISPPPQAATTPTKPNKVVVKTKNNVLESTSPNTQLAQKLDAMSLAASPSTSPTKRVYHASPAKENRVPIHGAGEKLQITLRPPEDDSLSGMSEQAKKSLRSINALRGLTLDEIEIINKPSVKRLATVTQLCTPPHLKL